MDFLKAEIAAKKRKAVSPPSDSTASSSAAVAQPTSKYIRRGDLEKLQEQERQRELEQQRRKKDVSTASRSPTSSSVASGSTPKKQRPKSSSASLAKRSRSSLDLKATPDPEEDQQTHREEKFNISNEEAIRRLRAKGEPIRLFAETDKERRLRLRALELIEEKGGSLGQNDFRNALQSAESLNALELLQKRNIASTQQKQSDATKLTQLENLEQEKQLQQEQQQQTQDSDSNHKDGDGKNGATASSSNPKPASSTREGVGMNSVLDLTLIQKDIDRVYPIIYYTLKGLLEEWASTLALRPDHIKHTTQGKLVSATQVQSAEYLKPLFKQLRKRSIAADVLMRIAEIVHYMQKREYRKANDSYLQLSIGNAPWPIGVTMVGIHERSGREKIFSSNVAHVLNDEVSRKYIQSLKRLMTFAQSKYPPKDLSMMMG